MPAPLPTDHGRPRPDHAAVTANWQRLAELLLAPVPAESANEKPVASIRLATGAEGTPADAEIQPRRDCRTVDGEATIADQ